MDRAMRVLGWVLAIGAVGWLVKVSLIAANGGENTSEGIVAVFFFVGFIGLFIGSASIGLRALRGRPAWMRIVAAVASILACFALFLAYEALGNAVLGTTDPKWMGDEVEIVLLAITGAIAAAWVLRRSPAHSSMIAPASTEGTA